MNTMNHKFITLEELNTFLATTELCAEAENSKSILVQIYSSVSDIDLLSDIINRINTKLPTAVIVGSTTVGEISMGCLNYGTIIVSFTFFEFAEIGVLVSLCSNGEEKQVGQRLIANIVDTGNDIAGVFMFATPLTIDIAEVFAGMSGSDITFPIFGGGAGVYDDANVSIIFYGSQFIHKGLISVTLMGDNLHIYSDSHLGWQPLSKEMTITKVEGTTVKMVDDMRAYDVYKNYLNIKNDKNFFTNVLEFPFLINRDGYTLARVPFFVDEEGAIEFIADIAEEETFRIGYGDPERIVQNAVELQKSMAEFQPDAIFIFACICRRFLMQNDVNLETQPFESIAPTVGFFTYGEIHSTRNKLLLLNSTIVVVGMREGEKKKREPIVANTPENIETVFRTRDPYSDKHNRIVSSLLNFIMALTSELETSNNELTRLSEIDKLTQIYNRLKLDKILDEHIARCHMFQTKLTCIILDIDYFKNINDNYGHLTGDSVLIEMAQILASQARGTDIVGRWGGEEFLIILPSTNLEQAAKLAERLRKYIEQYHFKKVNNLTCSLGVSSCKKGDTRDAFIHRADNALYIAKRGGRNRVEYLSNLE